VSDTLNLVGGVRKVKFWLLQFTAVVKRMLGPAADELAEDDPYAT